MSIFDIIKSNINIYISTNLSKKRYYMLFSYQTGYIMWHSRLRIYIPWDGNVTLYTLSDSWITYITDLTIGFLAHLAMGKRPSSVRPLISFSHLNLLLWNRWTDFNQTCQKCSLDLCFWCWFEIQHGC